MVLEDSSGNILANGATGAKSYSQGISDFVSPGGGTYYVLITGGAGGDQFNLVVTENSGFDTGSSTQVNPQPLPPSGTVLGAIAPGAGLFTLDDNLYYGPFPIYPTDPSTGVFGTPINSPLTAANNPFGENMAYDGTNLYVNDGAFSGTNTIYKIDPSTGAVLAQGNPGTVSLTGLAFLGGSLYGADLYGDVWKIDPTTFASTFAFSNSALYPLTGLTGNPDNGELYGVNQFQTLFEIDPTSGSILALGARQLAGSLRAGHRLLGRPTVRL